MQLDGEEAPRTTTMRYENLPGGTYKVCVTLFGSNGQPAPDDPQVNIISLADR